MNRIVYKMSTNHNSTNRNIEIAGSDTMTGVQILIPPLYVYI
jgi:hypothetical protein